MNEKDLEELVQEQKVQLNETNTVIEKLEIRVSANERYTSLLGGELRELRKLCNKTFWLVLITLLVVLIILGS